jgi:signal transduction histidine kinase
MKVLTLILLLFSFDIFAQKSDIFHIDSLPTEGVLLDKGWKWHEGDSPDWAKTDFDDTKWDTINPTLTIPVLIQIYTHKPHWLRLKLGRQNPQSVTLSVNQSGASEIFLNGKLIKALGDIENKETKTKAYNPLNEQIILNLDSSVNTLAIRYYFQKGLNYDAAFGERFLLFSAKLNSNKFQVSEAEKYAWEGFNIGVPFILFIVHLIFYLYYTPVKTNLWYSLSSFFGFLGSYILFKMRVSHDIEMKNTLINYAVVFSMFNIIFLFYTIYLFLKQKNKWLVIIFISLSLISLFNHFLGFSELEALVTFVYVAFVLYMSIQANRRSIQGAKSIIWGLVFYAIFWSLFLLSFQLQGLHSISSILFHLATLTLPIIISSLLGLEFKNTNIALIKNLEDINSLANEKQQILATQNETLEKQVTERTAELEHKNRDLEIEAALERIRARALEMQSSDEFIQVALAMREQMNLLGQKELEASVIQFYPLDKGYIDSWQVLNTEGVASGDIIFGKTKIPFNTCKLTLEWLKAYQTHQTDYTIVAHDAVLHEWLTELIKISPEVGQYLGDWRPNTAYYHFSKFSNGALSIATSQVPPTEESKYLLKRTASVFDLAYKRYIDLQKSEAQFREVQIEIALEKIRNRSLTMRHSDELKEVMSVMFEKMTELNVVKDGGVGIHLFTDDSKDSILWVVNQINKPSCISLPYEEKVFSVDSYVTQMFKAKKEGVDIFNNVQSFDAKNRYFNYVFAHNSFEIIPPFVRDFILTAQSHTFSMAIEKNSSIVVDSWIEQRLTEDAFDVVKRVARVFEQAYIRFLDLKKAEEQSREAQIEVALERVRNRTMAMQNSDELREAANLLSKEVRGLGIPIWSCGYNIMEKDEKACLGWMSTEGSIQPSFRIPLKVSPTFIKFYESRQNGVELFEEKIGGTDLETHYKYMLTLDGFADILKGFINSGHQLPTFQVNTVVNFTQGNLIFISAEPIPQAHDIFKRFAYVFEQTFTRFLDLQKAEAQTREAQIEIAVERVRAKALGMHKSDELLEVVSTLRKELAVLNIYGLTAATILLEQDNGNIRLLDITQTEEEGVHHSSWDFEFNLNETDHQVYFKRMWLEKDKYFIIEQNESDIMAFLSWLSQYRKEDADEITKTVKTHNITHTWHPTIRLEKGKICIDLLAPPSVEVENILIKIGNAFDFAYTRFKDLEQKEKLAKQAEKDLIKLKEEKSKTDQAITELKATQTQLIQKEKLASLGELTAGIAHEIQNPLNFVNNFSELSVDLAKELKEEIDKVEIPEKDKDYIGEILTDLTSNQEKINHHGKRASSIVKGMLEHSRASTGVKEMTDINALADEYFRLSYHGLRAKDKGFNATMETDFDKNLPKINVIPQDMGRVLLNLFNNAFYAVHQRQQLSESLKLSESYTPSVFLTTQLIDNQIVIKVKDNGTGMPESVRAKVFQPFFTTKPTGQGTGLGLSLAYDIVTKGHGGNLEVISKENEFTEFMIKLPL